MAVNEQATKLAQLINPEVMGDFIEKKLTNKLLFSPLAVIGYELQGNAGDTLSIPTWSYIGKAEDVAEGEDITLAKLGATKTTVKVKKAGKGVELTDEAVLSGLGDPLGQAELQLAKSIAHKVNHDCLEVLKGTTTLTHTAQTTGGFVNKDVVADALVKFGEDVEGVQVMFISPDDYASIRKDPMWIEVANGEKVISGQVGQIMGCAVVVTADLVKGTVLIVRAGALGIELKRDTMMEMDRDIIAKSTILTIDKHYVAYLKDASKVIKVTITSAEA